MKFSRLLDKDFWALLISIIFSLILFFNSETDSVITVQADVADVVNLLTYPQTWYQDIFLTKNENRKLQDSLVISNLHLSKYKKYKDENDELRKMLETASFISGVFNDTIIISKLKEPQPMTLVPARVTNRNSASIETIIINVGRDHVTPIKENLAVLDISGGLLGKTIAVGSNASKVQLITDNNFSVSIRVTTLKIDEDNNDTTFVRTIGNFIPTIGKYGILEGILKSTNLSPGKIAYTSGISDIYPADIPVAKVISANKDNNKPFQDVKVEILSDFNNLNYIFIIQ